MYDKPTTTIKSWAEDDRPREKMILKGAHSLSNAELIAIILNTGFKSNTALDLAKNLLNNVNNNLNDLSKLSCEDLCKIKGIGQSKAISILAMMEFSKRKNAEIRSKKEKIRKSDEVYVVLKQHFENLSHEEFYVVYLNRANEIIATKQISKGGISGTIADSRLIFKQAINYLASGIILAHNHPSGNPKPSEQDLKLTKKMVEIGVLMEINVLDHIICTDNTYFSFSDEGLL